MTWLYCIWSFSIEVKRVFHFGKVFWFVLWYHYFFEFCFICFNSFFTDLFTVFSQFAFFIVKGVEGSPLLKLWGEEWALSTLSFLLPVWLNVTLWFVWKRKLCFLKWLCVSLKLHHGEICKDRFLFFLFFIVISLIEGNKIVVHLKKLLKLKISP